MLTFFADIFCAACVKEMADIKFYLFLAAACCITLFCLFQTYGRFIRSRLIDDMPTSRIRSASQGYAEITGKAVLLDAPQLSPLSNTLCLWWRHKVEERDSDNDWSTVEQKTCKAAFFIDDGTGHCEVQHQGAEISCIHERTWYGDTKRPLLKPQSAPSNTWGATLLKTNRSGDYRYREELILEGDNIYALGEFITDSTHNNTRTLRQRAGDIIRQWKQDYSKLLNRFDTNKDGELSIKEWKSVQQAAAIAAQEEQREASQQPEKHYLKKPSIGNMPFIITSKNPDDMVKQFRLKALAFAVAFLVTGAFSSWLIGSRFF